MTLGQPVYLALLLIVALMAGLAVRLMLWRRAARASFAGPQARHWHGGGFWPAMLLLLAASVLIVVAVAHPRWGSTTQVHERQGVDLVIVLDVSKSMTATDVQPSRLELAQSQLVRLIESERGNRFGLVLFAGSAILRSPLTTDALAMEQLVQGAGSEAGLVTAGSDIGAALDQAKVILENSDSAGKAILVVSDGEDHAGGFSQRAADLHAQGILVLAAGVGTTEGSTLIVTNAIGSNPQVKVDESGQPIVTKLDEANLQALAAAGGGRYLRLDNTNLLSFRDDLSRLSQTPLGQETQVLPIERFQLFVAAALVLLVAAWFVPSRLRLPSPRRLLRVRLRPEIALLLLAIGLGACSQNSLRSRNETANRAYEAGNYDDALTQYQTLIAARPDVPELSYNSSNTENRLGNYDRAVEEAQRALPPTSADVGDLTYYTLGNSELSLGNLEQAYDAYRNALLLNPDDADAKYNLEVTLAMLQQRQQEQTTTRTTAARRQWPAAGGRSGQRRRPTATTRRPAAWRPVAAGPGRSAARQQRPTAARHDSRRDRRSEPGRRVQQPNP